MSDTNYSNVSRNKLNVPISVIDEAWESEVLSDDGKLIPSFFLSSFLLL